MRGIKKFMKKGGSLFSLKFWKKKMKDARSTMGRAYSSFRRKSKSSWKGVKKHIGRNKGIYSTVGTAATAATVTHLVSRAFREEETAALDQIANRAADAVSVSLDDVALLGSLSMSGDDGTATLRLARSFRAKAEAAVNELQARGRVEISTAIELIVGACYLLDHEDGEDDDNMTALLYLPALYRSGLVPEEALRSDTLRKTILDLAEDEVDDQVRTADIKLVASFLIRGANAQRA